MNSKRSRSSVGDFDAGSEFLLGLGLNPGLLYFSLLANDPIETLTTALTDPLGDLNGAVTDAADLLSKASRETS